MTDTVTLSIDNNNVLELKKLKNSVTKVFDNAATVTATLYKCDKTTKVVGETWPVTLTHDGGTDGTYRKTLADIIEISDDPEYWSVVKVTGSGGEKGTFNAVVLPETRMLT